jgi:peptidoglycan/LPS O-acetylase OafA/YrhL
MTKTLSRLVLIDFLRGIAAIGVLIWHYQHFYYTEPGVNPIRDQRQIQPLYEYLSVFYNFGGIAVQFFWVISGFVFSYIYFNKSKIEFQKFWINRFARLYPLHFLTLMIVALLQFISWQTEGRFQIYEFNDVKHFILNLFLISHWGFESGNSFNEPIWSVSVEVLIYLLFFLTHSKLSKSPLVSTGTAAVFLYYLYQKFQNPIIECGLFFYLGAFVCQIANYYQKHLKLLLALAAVGLMSSFNLSNTHLFMTIGFPLTVLVASLIDFKIKKWPSFMRAFGDLSYGIYLIHIPVQIFIILILNHFNIDRLTVLSKPLFFISYILFVIVLAAIIYRKFELPARTKIRRFAK